MAARHLILQGLLVVATLGATPALSQTESRRQKAEKLAQAGELLFDAGKYEDALRQFLDAYELFEPPEFVIPEVLWNIARCLEETGDDLGALQYFQEFRSVAASAEYRAAVDERLRQVRERLAAEVEVTVSPAGARAWLDGEPLPLDDGKARRRLAPGLHSLKAQAPGCREQERSFRLEPREQRSERLELPPITGTLEVTASRPDWTGQVRVLVDGREVFAGDLPTRIEVPSGWRTVRLEAAGVPEAQVEAMEIPKEGQVLATLRVPEPQASGAREPPVAAADSPAGPVQAETGPAAARRRGAWAALGSGLALAALGAGGLGLGAWDRQRVTSAAQAPDGVVTGMDEAEARRLADRARTWNITGGVLLGVGGAAILTGAVLLLTRSRSQAGEALPAVAAEIGPDSARLVARFHW